MIKEHPDTYMRRDLSDHSPIVGAVALQGETKCMNDIIHPEVARSEQFAKTVNVLQQ